ncbi:TPA: CD3337/EF1877 family mobilome membrane protein [Enterococcus faecium]
MKIKKLKMKHFVQVLGVVCVVCLGLYLLGSTVQAVGLIDDTVDSANVYSKYPVDNYQLDYFVDSSWDWLPWNWGDGIGKSVMYGIYAITNFLWLINVYLSNATGYLVGEAYSLDFIKETSEGIGENIQMLAGINEHGFMSTGFFPGLLLLLLVVLGIYVAYTGILKRESSKAINAIVSFVTIFLLSASFIAYSGSYINKINEFSADISNASLNIGSRMILSDSTSGKESVDAIRDSLFELQVLKPWMILQFGNANSEEIGEDRVTELEAVNPFENKGKDRIEIVKTEINDHDNDYLTITKTVNRLGTTVFILIFNVILTIFVIILTGIMIFSQVLFLIFAIFLPISCLLAMIPGFNHMMKQAIMKLFNVIMMRTGITLILTVSFMLSNLIYNLTSHQPFFLVAFLQIVIFAGIFFKLNDLMGMMALRSADSQTIGSRLTRRPRRTISRAFRSFALHGLAFKGAQSWRKGKNDKKENGASTNLEKKKQGEGTGHSKQTHSQIFNRKNAAHEQIDKQPIKGQVKEKTPKDGLYKTEKPTQKSKENKAVTPELFKSKDESNTPKQHLRQTTKSRRLTLAKPADNRNSHKQAERKRPMAIDPRLLEKTHVIRRERKSQGKSQNKVIEKQPSKSVDRSRN